MRPSTAARFAWSAAAVTVIFSLAGLALGLAHYPETPLYDFWFEGLVAPPVFVIVGALIVSRRPDNLIGWLFLSGVCGGLQMLLGSYATVALLQPSSGLGGGEPAVWLAQILQFQFVAAIVFLVLLFPTGSLISRAWRPIAWLLLLSLGLSVAATGLEAGPLENMPFATNPFGVESATSALKVAGAVGGGLALVCVVAAIGSLIVRLRRSRGFPRQQIKWFVYSAVVGLTVIIVSTFAPIWQPRFGTLAWTIGPLSLPVATGIAVLRYRLYDIDRLINRSLVYGLVTAVLVGGYAACVLIFRVLLPLSSDSTVAVAASTLAMAALFGPLRRRVQSAVDRRFNRQRYNAALTVEKVRRRPPTANGSRRRHSRPARCRRSHSRAGPRIVAASAHFPPAGHAMTRGASLSGRLRRQTDLDALSDDLIGVVRETVKPAHASLWLRAERES